MGNLAKYLRLGIRFSNNVVVVVFSEQKKKLQFVKIFAMQMYCHKSGMFFKSTTRVCVCSFSAALLLFHYVKL